jgi:SpoVK/Ycf46/Vps4 family AAA+-type ATPase
VLNDGTLEHLFAALPPQCIVLLEDIDAVGLKRHARKAEDDSDDSDSDSRPRGVIRGSCTLSGLLNVLDGVTSQEGRIVLMTSNVAEDLDEALTRPGRIDKTVFMGDIGQEASREMFLRMYRPDPNEHSESLIWLVEDDKSDLTELATTFADKIPESTFSPAQLQGYLISHRNQPAQAVAECSAWVEGEKARMKELKAREAEQARKRASRRRERKARMQRRLYPKAPAPYITGSDSDVSTNRSFEPHMARPSGGSASAKFRRPKRNKTDPELPSATSSADHQTADTSIIRNGVDAEDEKSINGDEKRINGDKKHTNGDEGTQARSTT